MDKLQIILSLIGIFAIVRFFVMRKKQITKKSLQNTIKSLYNEKDSALKGIVDSLKLRTKKKKEEAAELKEDLKFTNKPKIKKEYESPEELTNAISKWFKNRNI